jgi:hypothetical protein
MRKRLLAFSALALALLPGCVRRDPPAPAAPAACPLHEAAASASAGGTGAYLCLEHAGSGAPGSAAVDPGPCDACGRPRAGVAVVLAHDCARHPGQALPEGGSCPLCDRPLLPRTLAAAWRCDTHPRPLLAAQGACPACGAPAARALFEVPHGDHNPKHGGLFFMAADKWHHIEGTLPEAGLFRLHIYDDFTRPIAARGITGTLTARHAGGASGANAGAIPLVPSADGAVLEARFPELAPPVEVALDVSFPARAVSAPARPSEHFDFIFRSLSVTGGEDAPAAAGRPPALEIPAAPSAIAAALRERARRVDELARERAFAELHRPALEARELALALEERGGAGSPAGAALARGAARVVRGAWLLDLHGDRGDAKGVEAARAIFQAGIEEACSAVEGAGVGGAGR